MWAIDRALISACLVRRRDPQNRHRTAVPDTWAPQSRQSPDMLLSSPIPDPNPAEKCIECLRQNRAAVRGRMLLTRVWWLSAVVWTQSCHGCLLPVLIGYFP